MYKFLKRLIDVIIALTAFIILFLPMVIIAIAIKIDSRGPVFFKQIRTGKNGRNFTLYKFRTMVAENDVLDFSIQDKHTRVGHFLRKTSLDELGQIINILNGTMSFIGPRPWIPEYYENMNEEQRHRCDVLPGMTGLAQCMGRNKLSIFEKINYDLEYVKNFSLKEDIKIVFLTVKTVLSGSGADAGKSTIQDELEDLKEQDKLINNKNNISNQKTKNTMSKQIEELQA